MNNNSEPAPDADFGGHGPILIVTTCWWAYVARTAHLLAQAGCDVAVLCPEGHAAIAVPGVTQFKQSAFQPIKALSNAIRVFGPAVVIPGDDRAVSTLHKLHRSGSPSERRLVERSLGLPEHYRTTTSRVGLLALAERLGIPTPLSRTITDDAGLASWVAAVPKPWVLKVDGAWAGEGVRIAETTEEAFGAYKRLRRRLARTKAIKRALVNRDAFWLADWIGGGEAELSVQSYVDGRPANLAMFCRDGEMLAANLAEAVVCADRTGPSTIIKLIDRDDVLASARKLARELGLNGFHGLDFMLEHDTDRALLIELNPRLTALSNIRCGPGRDPVGAATTVATGDADATRNTVAPNGLIANFPVAWHHSREHPLFAEAYADVPWDEPALVAEMLKPNWPERLPLARLYGSGVVLARSVQGRAAALRSSLAAAARPTLLSKH